MKNPIYYLQAERLVSECKIPPHLIGFTYLAEAALIKSEDPSQKLLDIYKAVANKYGSTSRAVTRSISYAISKSADDMLDRQKHDVFNGKVIADLAVKLRSKRPPEED